MGTSIGTVLISYDVSAKNPEVKAALVKLGYSDAWKNTGEAKVYNLPNTTLWHTSKSTNQALSDMKSVCTGLSVTLEKAVAVRASEFVGI